MLIPWWALAFAIISPKHLVPMPKRSRAGASVGRLRVLRPTSGFSRAALRLLLRSAEPGLAGIRVAGQVVAAHFLKLELDAFPNLSRLAHRCFEMRLSRHLIRSSSRDSRRQA